MADPTNRSKCTGKNLTGNTLDSMLDDMDRAVLDYERAWANQSGPKDRSIEMDLGLTAEAYYSRLRTLILDRRAATYDPLTVLRLRRIIDPLSPAEAVG
jgi:ABC-type lipopolysaccharide export system ATPase subunit